MTLVEADAACASSGATTNAEDTSVCTGTCVTCPSLGSCMDRLVCRCLKVTEHAVVTAIRELGASTIRELQLATEAGAGCGCCRRELRQYLQVYASSSSSIICSAK
jgi:bacterioferritin-associated ferredoxin